MDDFKRIPREPRPATAASTQPPQPAPVQRPAQPVVPPQPLQPRVNAPQPQTQLQDVPLPEDISVTPPPQKKSRKKRRVLAALVALLVLAVAALGGAWLWYQAQLGAVESTDQTKKVVVIESGSTPTMIADQLESEGLIRSALAFFWYTRLEGVQNTLQAGSYRLSPSETTPAIVDHLVGGKVDTFQITFLPGATVTQNKKVFTNAGYSQSEVDAAFTASYASPLFEGKPASADLEGYIYGETYSFGSDTTVKAILEHTFEHFNSIVEKEGFVASYRAQGLSLYQGITLASIIQREASPSGTDAPQIAQVFYTRIAQGMPLGSDVTYQYIADKTGVKRDTNLDSPYNTRRYPGLPPGPIAAPGLNALKAVAAPAAGNYIYFLSGDDDITYFGRTLEEHESNIRNHCAVKCQII